MERTIQRTSTVSLNVRLQIIKTQSKFLADQRSSRQPPLSKSNSPVSSHQQPARCAYISPIKHDLSQAATNKYPDISPVSSKILFNSPSPPSPHCDRINLHTTYSIPCRPPPTQYSHIQTSSPWLPQCRHTLSSRFDLPLHQSMSPPENRIPPRLNETAREPAAATSLYTFKPFLDEPSTRPSPKQHPCTSPSRLTSLSACAEVSPPQSRFPRFSRSSPSRHCLPTHPLNGPPLRPELSPGPTAPRSVLAPCPKRCFTNHYGYLDYCPVPDLPSYTPNSLWWEEQAALTLRRSQAERRHSRPTTTLPETGNTCFTVGCRERTYNTGQSFTQSNMLIHKRCRSHFTLEFPLSVRIYTLCTQNTDPTKHFFMYIICSVDMFISTIPG